MSRANPVDGEVGQGLPLVQEKSDVVFAQDLSKSSDLERIREAVAVGPGAVLCNPTKETMSAFADALGVPEQANVDAIEMYAVHGAACITSYKPVRSPMPGARSATPSAMEAALAPAMHVQQSPSQDARDRIGQVLNGLELARDHNARVGSVRETGPRLLTLESAAGGGGPSDIWGMANMNLGGNYQHYTFTLAGESKTVQCSFNTNLWGAGMNLWGNPKGTPAQRVGSDWYLIMATCVFGPRNAWHPSADGLLKGWYAYEYVLGLAPQDYPKQTPGPDTLQLMSSSPESSAPRPETHGVTSSESTSVNGSIGFFGPTLTGTIGVGHSWSMSKSNSFSVSFCDIQNASTNGGSGANGYWSYTFNDLLHDGSPSNYEINTFQPSGALVWKMPDSYRAKGTDGFRIQLQFGATFRNRYYQDAWRSQDWKVGISGANPAAGTATVKLKYPLSKAQQEAIEKAKEGWATTNQACDVWASDGLSPIAKTNRSIPPKTEIREIIQAYSQVGPGGSRKEFWKVRCKDQKIYKGDFYIPVEQAPVPPSTK